MTLQILGIAIPTLAVFLAIWRGDRRIDDLKGHIDERFTTTNKRIDDLRTEMNTRLLTIEGEMRGFYQTTGAHGARLDNLEAARKAGGR